MQKEIKCPVCASFDLKYVRYNNHLNRIKPRIKSVFRSSIFSRKSIKLCNICGFGSVDISKAKLDNFYKNTYWKLRSENIDNYDEFKTHPRGIYQLKYLSEIIKKPNKILEIGGGLCNFSLLLRDKFSDVKIYSDELSKIFERYYKENSINYFHNEQKWFDHIHISHVLEHVIDPENYILNMMPLLNENGTIYIEVPNCSTEYFDLNFIDEPHVNFFSMGSLCEVMNKNNLKIIDINSFGPSWEMLYNFKSETQSFKSFYDNNFNENSKDGCLIRLILKK